MLRLSASYIDRSILSLRTGSQIGIARKPVINPNNLKIEGWYCDNLYEKGEFVLPYQEIRDLISKGLVVNDHDALTEPQDMVRLGNILKIRFELIGKSVVTETNKKLGKITDYAVDDQDYYVKKIYVTPNLLKGLVQDQLIIDRSQIIEISDKKIVVSEPTIKAGVTTTLRAEA